MDRIASFLPPTTALRSLSLPKFGTLFAYGVGRGFYYDLSSCAGLRCLAGFVSLLLGLRPIGLAPRRRIPFGDGLEFASTI